LPDELLLLIQTASHFNDQVADLMDQLSDSAVGDGVDEFSLDELLGFGGDPLPDVLVVLGVRDVLRVCHLRDVPPQHHCCQRLHLLIQLSVGEH